MLESLRHKQYHLQLCVRHVWQEECRSSVLIMPSADLATIIADMSTNSHLFCATCMHFGQTKMYDQIQQA